MYQGRYKTTQQSSVYLPQQYDIRCSPNMASSPTADEVLKDVSLSGKVAIVTGCTTYGRCCEVVLQV